MTPEQLQTRACILKYTSFAVLCTSVLTYVSSHFQFQAPKHDAWLAAAGACFVAYIISALYLLAAAVAGTPTRTARRAVVAFLFVGVNMTMMTLAEKVPEDIVIHSLFICTGILLSMAAVAHVAPDWMMRSLFAWAFVCVIVSVFVSLIGSVVLLLSRGPFETFQYAMTSVGVALCSLLLAADIHYYVKDCVGEDCCENGTVAIWLDFVNILQRVMVLLQKD